MEAFAGITFKINESPNKNWRILFVGEYLMRSFIKKYLKILSNNIVTSLPGINANTSDENQTSTI